MLYRFIFKILKELAETQIDLEITRSSNMTILTLLLEKKICSKEEYVSIFNEIQSKNMENINQIKNKIHEIEEQIKQREKEGLIMLVKATAIVKFSGIYKWDIINPLKDCLKNGKPIKNEQLGYECNVFDLFIHDATKAFVNAEFKLKIGVILPVTEEQFIEANKNIKEIVNTDTAIINCGAYGKGRIYHLEYTKLADSERGRL